MNKTVITIIFLVTCVIITHAQQKQINKILCVNNTFTESIDTSDFRSAKNIRYNTGGMNLTTRDSTLEYFIETFIPRGLPILPIDESSDIVTGKIVKIQPYFSQDKSQIYTEITINVEETFKNLSPNIFMVSKTIILTELGGSIELDSRKEVRYEVKIDGRGNLCNDRRYIFFIESINANNDYQFIKVYELDNGKVYTVGNKKKLFSEKSATLYKLSNKENEFLKKLKIIINNQL